MADYWVDDGGDGSAGTSWATAYASLAALVTAVPAALTTSGNRVFIGHDTVQTQASALTVTGPTSGLPVILISADRTDTGAVPAYLAGTSNQIETTGANAITFDGSFALYGLKAVSGAGMSFTADANELMYLDGDTLVIGANGIIDFSTGQQGTARNVTIDMTADGASTRTNAPINLQNWCGTLHGFSFINAGFRTGTVFRMGGSETNVHISGMDISGFTQATCELVNLNNGTICAATFANIKTVASPTFLAALPTTTIINVDFYNVGPADAPTALVAATTQGTVVSTPLIYRTGGATVEGDATAWLITTTAVCGEGAPFYTPWIYGTVNSTGSKTFDCYITNDTADFTDAQVWLEVEYLADADSGKWTLATDQRATITTTAAAQTDDTTSTWNGAGPSYTYKQKLSVAATIGETGQYRARVAVGVASIASSRYFYVDPKITVS